MGMFTTQTRVTGLSGFDTESMVSQLMKAESMKYDKLYQQRELLRYKKESYQSVSQSLISFQDKFLSFMTNTATNIRSTANWQAASAKVSTGGSASSAITVRPSTSTQPGKYTVEVKQVAQNDVYKSTASYKQAVTGEHDIDWASIKDGDTIKVALDGGASKEITITGALFNAVQDARSAATQAQGEADFVTRLNDELKAKFGVEPVGMPNAGDAKVTASITNGKLTVLAGTGHTASVASGVKTDSKAGLTDVSTAVTQKLADWNTTVQDAITNNGGKVNFTADGVNVEVDVSKVKNANGFAAAMQDAFNTAYRKANGADAKSTFSFKSDGTNVYISQVGAKNAVDTVSFTGLNLDGGGNAGSLASDLFEFTVDNGNGKGPYTVKANIGGAIDQKGIADALNKALSAFKDPFDPEPDEKKKAPLDLKVSFSTDSAGNLTIANNNAKTQATVDLGGGNTATMAAGSALEQFGLELPKKSTGLDLNAAIETIPGLNLTSTHTSGAHKLYQFEINGKNIQFDSSASLNDIMNKINTSGADVKISFDAGKQQFTLEGSSTGALNDIKFNNIVGNFNGDVFGFNNTAVSHIQSAQDAIISVNQAETSRDTNNFTIDGLTINLTKDAKGATFDVEVARDSTQVSSLVKSFVADYNDLIVSLNKSYNQTRTTYNTYSYYEPLTEAQKKDMSEAEVKKWEDQAKVGMLYRDQTIGNIISSMRSMIYDSVAMSDGSKLSLYQMGITVDSSGNSANNKVGTLKIDEAKFADFLANNADKVAEYFTKGSDILVTSEKAGAQKQRYNENGFAERLNDIIWRATSSTRGTLTDIAGLPNTSKTDNKMSQSIAKQDDKMAIMMKYLQKAENNYYSQFSKMEAAINQANSQMASIMSMMGVNY